MFSPPAHSVHSVRSSVKHSVTFASEDEDPSTSSSGWELLENKAPDSIVSPSLETTAIPRAESSRAAFKHNSLLQLSLDASKRTFGKLSRRKNDTAPVTVTEEFAVEHVVYSHSAPTTVQNVASRDSLAGAGNNTSSSRNRNPFAKLASFTKALVKSRRSASQSATGPSHRNRSWYVRSQPAPQHSPAHRSNAQEHFRRSRALRPLGPSTSVPHPSHTTLHQTPSRFFRRSRSRSRFSRSRSTVHLEPISEASPTAEGQEVIHPDFFNASPVSVYSELYQDTSASVSRRQSWGPPSSHQSRSRLSSTASLPEGRAARSSRPVSEALFPYTFESSRPPVTGKPKLSIVTTEPSKEPEQRTPKSILKEPSRAFFRRASSPSPTRQDTAYQQDPSSRDTPFNNDSLAPPSAYPETAPTSALLFPLTPFSPAPPSLGNEPIATSAGDLQPPPPGQHFVFPPEKPPTPPHIPITVEDELGQSLEYIEYIGKTLSTGFRKISKSQHNMGVQDMHDTGITFADDDLEDENFQWFQNGPPPVERRAPPPPTASTIYQPLPGVVDSNHRILTALNNSHTALWKQYLDFGQLGVFGWTSDFSDLIDELKSLGFDGNMFVSTRQAALDACTRILRLKIDIKMQIILIYLTNQVSRLRRFLDADKQWDDYPQVDFPLDPYNEA